MRSPKDKTKKLYDHECDCGGWVGCSIRDRELIQVTKTDYVALEHVPIGVCGKCKAHYYHASVLAQAEELHRNGARREMHVPVGQYVQAG